MTTPDVEKAAFRTISRNKRLSLSSQRCSAASLLASQHITATDWWQMIETIALYAAYGSEMDPASIEQFALSTGKTVFYPRVQGEVLEFAQGTLADMNAGFAGILEPSGPAVSIESIDVVIVPGLAFDASGQRLGSGRGFYDRTLPKNSRSIGFAYAEQIVQHVPTNPHDRRMDAVLTDEGFVLKPRESLKHQFGHDGREALS